MVNVIKTVFATAASAAFIVISAACGDNAPPPTPTPPPTAAPSAPTPTPSPEPTQERLHPEAFTPSPEPTPTAAATPTSAASPSRNQGTGQLAPTNNPKQSESSLVPPNPETSDEFLLQEIYAELGMEYLVETYGPDTDLDIDWRNIDTRNAEYIAEQQAALASHPYRHIIPGTLHDFRNGIAHTERFLAYPWHEPAAPGNGPWNFGQNGIRATLLQAVTAGAERIAQDAGVVIVAPDADAAPDGNGYRYTAWNTEQRLATTPAEITITSVQEHERVQFPQLTRPEPDNRVRCGYDAETQWTLISDHLPIYQVDVRHNICVYGNKPGQAVEDHPVRFTASAVIAFQHRHANFSDPERRADYNIAEINDLRGAAAKEYLHGIQTVPYTEPRWRPADFMHYAIIGDVIITPDGDPPAFAVTPTRSTWMAQPGKMPAGVKRNAWLRVSDIGELVCAKITASANVSDFESVTRPQVYGHPHDICPQTLHMPSPAYPNYHYPFPGELTTARGIERSFASGDSEIRWAVLTRELISQGVYTDQPTQHAYGEW